LLPTNVQNQLTQTMASANATLLSANTAVTNTDAQLTILATELDKTLENLSLITSNLNAQVQANTNILTEISTLITNTDHMVQGLKRHWLLRSAFKEKKTDKPGPKPGDDVPPALMPPRAPFPPPW
jgi:hypothetical protein